DLNPKPGAVELVLQRRYNPEGKARLNIVPGLLAVILTMTMVMMTALAVTRERERGTMENLLAMPVRPIEVMIGKIVPYIAIGSVQVIVILLISRLMFGIVTEGSVALLGLGTALFITVNLAIGFTISTVTQHQLQAMQASVVLPLHPNVLASVNDPDSLTLDHSKRPAYKLPDFHAAHRLSRRFQHGGY